MASAAVPGSPARADDCRAKAIDQLKAAAPDGFSIYRRLRDKTFFTRWITCDEVQVGLSTAVHESVHAITADEDVFPLVGGGDIARPHEVSAFFAPSRIARTFGTSDFVRTYLRPGAASSGTDFLYLLDELNAYSHDLNAAVDLMGLRSPDDEVDSRDGLAALMAFVAIYVQTAEESEPATWSGLRQPAVARTVSDLWDRAERVMGSSCGIPNFGTEDRKFIGRFCTARARSSMTTILGRAPTCPTRCLTPTADLDASAAPSEAAEADASSRAPASKIRPVARPFWSRAITRHAPPAPDPASGAEQATTR